MSNFILTKEQHTAFKAAWKHYLKTEAKSVKELVRLGSAHRGYAISFHVLRQILIADTQHIESKIVKAFASQKSSPYDGNAARSGLSEVSSCFPVKNKAYLAKRYPSFAELFAELTDEQVEQINKIASDINGKYLRGEIK